MRFFEVDQQRAVMPQSSTDPVAEGRLAEAHEALLLALNSEAAATCLVEARLEVRMRLEVHAEPIRCRLVVKPNINLKP
jgi:hypothetical protein